MKNKFVDFHHSTNIVQAKHAVSVTRAVVGSSKYDDQNVVWLEMGDDSQMSHLRQVLLSLDDLSLQKTRISKEPKVLSLQKAQEPKLSSPSSVLEKESTTFTSSNASQENKALKPTSKKQYITYQKPSLTQRFTGLLQSSVKSEKMTSFSSLVQNSIESNVSTYDFYYDGKVLNIITLLDTGGQPEYIHLLPTVNIHPMVTFVVHDLSKSLDDQVLVEFSERGQLVFEPYHLKYSNLDLIKFLMSNINDSVERTSSQVPQLVTVPGKDNNSYICCVGTHADKVDDPEVIKATNGKLTAMVEKLKCKTAIWEYKDGQVLFPVDNTTAGDDSKEDHIANFIRMKIDQLALERDIYELPITWMIFELEIRQLCSKSGKAYISFEDCCSIGHQTNIISSAEEVRNALIYHHLLGVLLYYPDIPGLQDYVIIDHQWLFDRISGIVCFALKHSSDMIARKTLQSNGILTKELIQQVHHSNEELKEEYFIALLVEMRIIAPIKREYGNEKDYFIPYILPTCNIQAESHDILSKYGSLQGDPLLIQFASNLLPRGVFCCLVVEMLQQLANDWDHIYSETDTRHTFSNLITLRLQNAYSLSLIDKLSYLEVQIRHQESDYYCQFPIHNKEFNILIHALRNVCKQLTFKFERIQYGFHCRCGKFDNEHISIVEGTPPFDFASCAYGSTVPTKLTNGCRIWLQVCLLLRIHQIIL